MNKFVEQLSKFQELLLPTVVLTSGGYFINSKLSKAQEIYLRVGLFCGEILKVHSIENN